MMRVKRVVFVLFWAVFCLAGVGSVGTAIADKAKKPLYWISFGRQFPLCQDVVKILNLPENAEFSKEKWQGGTFDIPKSFKDFSLPTWEIVPKDQWGQYIDPAIIAEWAQPFGNDVEENRRRLDGALLSEWGVMDGPVVQLRKTMIDIDHDGNKDEMIDFTSAIQVNDPKAKNPARMCTISKNAAPYMLDKDHGFWARGNNGRISGCFIFSYKGRAYVAGGGYGNRYISVSEYGTVEPISGKHPTHEYVCQISGQSYQ